MNEWIDVRMNEWLNLQRAVKDGLKHYDNTFNHSNSLVQAGASNHQQLDLFIVDFLSACLIDSC